MRAVIVGAGVSGVVTARVLSGLGVEVEVHEQRSDIGGVWSASRAYPGISTQDDRRSYAFSDLAYPAGTTEHPTGAEVRTYLESYVAKHGLGDRIHLGSAVVSAEPQGDGWRVRTRGPAGDAEVTADWLIAANGVFSEPHVPAWPGRDGFEAAGGRIVVPSDLGAGEALDDQKVVVVGWGKTACDLAAVSAGRATSTDVVARTLTWKYPKRIGLGVTFHHLVLTRAGERVIAAPYRSPDGRILLRRLPERLPRKLIGRAIARSIDRRTGLTGLGLRPTLDISASTSLETEGFFAAVKRRRIVVHREQTVEELAVDAGQPVVVLANGTRLPADVVVAATGYDQSLDFLAPGVIQQATAKADGQLLLHRRILAVDVPRLAFVGWAHSYRSPLTSEIAAEWLGAVITGALRLSAASVQRTTAAAFPLTRNRPASGRTAHLPGVSMLELDQLLDDLGLPLTREQKAAQRFGAFDPSVYAYVLPALRRRVDAHDQVAG